MNADFLEKILAHKATLIKEKRAYFDSIREKLSKEKLSRYGIFKKAISRPGQVNLIAEIKKASPSQGLIRKEFDVMGLARTYVEGGAAAISVLTEDKYFLGKPPYMRTVTEHFSVPVLTKDFIIDEGQIYEAFIYGASAILLIVAILEDEQMKRLMATAENLDMDCLIEVHAEKELDRALKAGAEIIGINNRDLRTFEVDLAVSERIIPSIPKDKVVVAESGIRTHEDILRLKNAGAGAVLIGETFLRANDVGSKIREVMGEEVRKNG